MSLNASSPRSPSILFGRTKTSQSGNLEPLRGLIQTKSWWDTVDALAVHGVGPVVKADRELQMVIDESIDDDDIWVAPTAILHELPLKG